MKPENGERKAYEEADGEFCLVEPSNYATNNDHGLAYLDQMSTQHQLRFDACNIHLLDMPSRSAVSSSPSNISLFNSAGFGPRLHNSASSTTSAGFEPLQLHLNLTPQQTPTPRHPKNFVTERQRRQTFNDKFQHLGSLLPNPNKNDRASIVGDAIEYIKELLRTVKELNILVEKKRCSRQRLKRYKPTPATEDDDNGIAMITNHGDTESPTVIKSEQVDQSLRSSWLQRKCKDTDIDVRIVDDEVTIKLVQRKKIINLLVYVSRAFDDLQLDLQHVTGGHVGDYYSFLFNTKISEGSSLYASAIANKLIEVVDRQYASLQ